MGLKTFLSFASKHIGLFKIVWQAQFVDMDAFKNYCESFAVRGRCGENPPEPRMAKIGSGYIRSPY